MLVAMFLYIKRIKNLWISPATAQLLNHVTIPRIPPPLSSRPKKQRYRLRLYFKRVSYGRTKCCKLCILTSINSMTTWKGYWTFVPAAQLNTNRWCLVPSRKQLNRQQPLSWSHLKDQRRIPIVSTTELLTLEQMERRR